MLVGVVLVAPGSFMFVWLVRAVVKGEREERGRGGVRAVDYQSRTLLRCAVGE